MKAALVLLGLVALGSSAPHPRKLFHEHFEDFIQIIIDEVQPQLNDLAERYANIEEFQNALAYVSSPNFKQIVYEMESLPEFKAMVDFLERDNIDILYFLDLFNSFLESLPETRTRQSASGGVMSSYLTEAIALFPKAKLSALFDQKMAEDEEFRVAMENLQSDEWQQILDALFENSTFQNEVQVLYDNGVAFDLIITEIKAIFGQN